MRKYKIAMCVQTFLIYTSYIYKNTYIFFFLFLKLIFKLNLLYLFLFELKFKCNFCITGAIWTTSLDYVCSVFFFSFNFNFVVFAVSMRCCILVHHTVFHVWSLFFFEPKIKKKLFLSRGFKLPYN